MKFHCFYQTSGNENRDEWISARDRDDAYAKLKARGIRPYRVEGRNPRRLPLGSLLVLAGVLAVVAAVLLYPRLGRRPSVAVAGRPPASIPRAQIYGDSAILQHCERAGWTNVFARAGDAWLARHARPGIPCDCPRLAAPPDLSTAPVAILPSDREEHAKMKRMVNGMKEELSAYLGSGGTPGDYCALCDERLRTEEGIFARVSEEFDRLRADAEKMTHEAVISEWEKKNAALRALGLPTVLLPESL